MSLKAFPYLYTALAAGAALLVLMFLIFAVRRLRAGRSRNAGGPNYLKGLTYLSAGETDKAIDEFVRLARMDPDSLEAYLSLGNLYRQRGDLDRAIRLHRGILARPSLDREFRMQVLVALGEDYQRSGLLGRAKEVFTEARRLFPDQSGPYLHLRRIYEEEKNWPRAFEIQKEINRITGDRDQRLLAHIKAEEGKAFLSAGEKQKARRCFREALKLDSSSPEALMNMARYYYEEGKADKAITLWEEVVLSHPQASYLVLPLLEEALFERGRYDDIKGLIQRILERYPENIPARRYLGNFYLRKGMLQEARKAFTGVLERQPSYRLAVADFLRSLLKDEDPERISDEIRSLLEMLENGADAFTCKECGLKEEKFRWRCPRCHRWDTYRLDPA